jgi:hypothetical protein
MIASALRAAHAAHTMEIQTANGRRSNRSRSSVIAEACRAIAARQATRPMIAPGQLSLRRPRRPWDNIGIGPGYRFQLADLVEEDLRCMAELVQRYIILLDH